MCWLEAKRKTFWLIDGRQSINILIELARWQRQNRRSRQKLDSRRQEDTGLQKDTNPSRSKFKPSIAELVDDYFDMGASSD